MPQNRRLRDSAYLKRLQYHILPDRLYRNRLRHLKHFNGRWCVGREHRHFLFCEEQGDSLCNTGEPWCMGGPIIRSVRVWDGDNHCYSEAISNPTMREVDRI